MAEHRARIAWQRTTETFTYPTYSRDHDWTFGSGQTIGASAAPEFLGTPTRVNPEEALVAALSSCHMLTFLAIAAKRNFVVDSYHDEAVGTLAKNAQRRLAITECVLRPRVVFSGTPPSAEQLAALHHEAHEHCFIASSVLTAVRIEPATAS